MLDYPRYSTQLRGDGCLTHQSCTQRIDGLYAQTCWMHDEVPSALAVTLQSSSRQSPDRRLVRIERHDVALRSPQGCDDALAHLSCGFAREGHREDCFGAIDACEQGEVTLDQKPGLAGAGRSLHDERPRSIERGFPRRGILRLQRITHRHCRSPPCAPIRSCTMRANGRSGKVKGSDAALPWRNRRRSRRQESRDATATILPAQPSRRISAAPEARFDA